MAVPGAIVGKIAGEGKPQKRKRHPGNRRNVFFPHPTLLKSNTDLIVAR
jgi:hypothetical protein